VDYSPRQPGGKGSITHSREDLSEGRGSLLSSPDVYTAPLSPTPSDTDSGIDKLEQSRSDIDSLNSSESKSKDNSPPGTWKKETTATSSITATLPSEEDVKWTTKQYTSTTTVTKNSAPEPVKPVIEKPVSLAPISPTRTPDDEGKVTVNVNMNKGAVGLGFCIEGGKGSPLGDRPVLVKRMFKGVAAAHGVLRPGDEIVMANDRDLRDTTHYAAWSYLKSLPEGTIRLVIRRRPLPTDE